MKKSCIINVSYGYYPDDNWKWVACCCGGILIAGAIYGVIMFVMGAKIDWFIVGVWAGVIALIVISAIVTFISFSDTELWSTLLGIFFIILGAIEIITLIYNIRFSTITWVLAYLIGCATCFGGRVLSGSKDMWLFLLGVPGIIISCILIVLSSFGMYGL